jgi:uncharacterized membrane protein
LAVTIGAAIGLVVLRGIPIVSFAAILLVLFLPGSAIVAALLPRAAMASWELVITSVGVSLALVIATGLFLNVTPGGLDPTLWTILLAAITAGSAVIAIVRREAGRAAGAGPLVAGPSSLQLPLPSRRDAWQIGAAVAVVLIIVGATRIMVASQPSHFTQLWMTEGAERGAVEIGVKNAEGEGETYLLQLHSEGATYPDVQFGLNGDGVWRDIVQLDPDATGELTADLYRLPDRSVPYRHVTLAPAEPSPS